MSRSNPKEFNQPIFQVLSFDVVLGALSVGLFAVTIFNVKPNLYWWVILPIAVWTTYTFDHLADGFKKSGKNIIQRHQFHYQYRKILFLLVLVFGTKAVLLSFIFLEKKIIIVGIGLSSIVVFYFGLVFYQDKLKIRYIHKEMIIALVYVFGIFLGPVIWGKDHLSLFYYIILATLIVLAWTESVMISFYDYSLDKADGLKSFTQIYGLRKTQIYLMFVHLLVTVVLFISLLFADDLIIIIALSIELVMNSILFALILYPAFFSISNRFRWIGESVFVLPGFIVLF